MDDTQLLLWWQGLHPCNLVLGWVEFFIGCAFLVLLYSRLKANFLIVWLVGNGVGHQMSGKEKIGGVDKAIIPCECAFRAFGTPPGSRKEYSPAFG
jgi:hypothetical protein